MATSPPSGPGGGSAPVTSRELFAADPVTIPNNGTSNLTWDGASGVALLDVSALAAPVVIVAGIYSVAVEVEPFTALTVGGWYQVRLALDTSGDNALISADVFAIAADRVPSATLTAAYYIPAGGGIRVGVTNHDGVSAQDFAINNAIVQRIT